MKFDNTMTSASRLTRRYGRHLLVTNSTLAVLWYAEEKYNYHYGKLKDSHASTPRPLLHMNYYVTRTL